MTTKNSRNPSDFDPDDEQKFTILREYFHKADEDDNGIIDIDEFLYYVEETTFQD